MRIFGENHTIMMHSPHTLFLKVIFSFLFLPLSAQITDSEQIAKAIDELLGEVFAVVEEPVKRYTLGNTTVVKEHSNRASRR